MFPVANELWILLAGALLVGLRLLLSGRRRRRRLLAQDAGVRGWRISRRDHEGLAARYGLFELMRHGYNRRCSDVIAAIGGRVGRAFCYHYETGFGKGHACRDLTVAVVETRASRPGVWLGPGRCGELVGAFGRYRQAGAFRPEAASRGGLTVKGDPSSAVSVRAYAESQQWLERHLDPVLSSRQDGGADVIEIRGPCVAIYREGIGSAGEQIELLLRAEGLAEALAHGEARRTAVSKPRPDAGQPRGPMGRGEGLGT
ncbi:MAG: hypothetical protein JXQ73_12420 [Phycisphaerae bacterium]|nr:hypothetical protein [Phycisphaerae bacterium]